MSSLFSALLSLPNHFSNTQPSPLMNRDGRHLGDLKYSPPRILSTPLCNPLWFLNLYKKLRNYAKSIIEYILVMILMRYNLDLVYRALVQSIMRGCGSWDNKSALLYTMQILLDLEDILLNTQRQEILIRDSVFGKYFEEFIHASLNLYNLKPLYMSTRPRGWPVGSSADCFEHDSARGARSCLVIIAQLIVISDFRAIYARSRPHWPEVTTIGCNSSCVEIISSGNFIPTSKMAPVGAPDLKKFIEDHVNSNKVMIFSKTTCPYCRKVNLCDFHSSYFWMHFLSSSIGMFIQLVPIN